MKRAKPHTARPVARTRNRPHKHIRAKLRPDPSAGSDQPLARVPIFQPRDALRHNIRLSQAQDHVNEHDEGKGEDRVYPHRHDGNKADHRCGIKMVREERKNEDIVFFQPGCRRYQRILNSVGVLAGPLSDLATAPDHYRK